MIEIMEMNEIYVFLEHDNKFWEEKNLTLKKLFGLLDDSENMGMTIML